MKGLKFYAKVNKLLGLDEDYESYDSKMAMLSDSKKDHVLLSGDPLKSDIPPKLIPVSCIAEYKKMTSFCVLKDDSFVDYPKPPSESLIKKMHGANSTKDFHYKLSHEEKQSIKKAATAYVYGNPEKLKVYESFINAYMFPTHIAYFASTTPYELNKPLIINSDKAVVFNHPVINVSDKGSIQIKHTPQFNMTSHTVNVETASKSFKVKSKPPDYGRPATCGNKGIKGRDGAPGNDGTQYKSQSHGCPYVCDTPPGNGGNGVAGTNGIDGSAGGAGGDQSNFTTALGVITGILIIEGGGQNGQDGGDGGKGGNGGNGGNAGINPGPCTPAMDGAAGNGGNGGKGGDAGNGGNGGNVIITYISAGGIDNQSGGAIPGNSGQGGAGGTVGEGIGGTGGKNGENGSTGKTGTKPTIHLNKVDSL